MDVLTANNITRDLRSRFTWESDGLIDSYHVLPATGQVRGDCDDFAVTVLYELAGRSKLRFWWWLAIGKARFNLVLTPDGERHVTLFVRGLGYTDNFRTSFSRHEDIHTPLTRVKLHEVWFKLAIGRVDPT